MLTTAQIAQVEKLQALGAQVSIDAGNPPKIIVRFADQEIELFTADAWDVLDELDKLEMWHPDTDRETLELVAVYPYIEDAVKRHGYCSPEHYAALGALRDTFDITL